MAANLPELHGAFVEWVYDQSQGSPLGDVEVRQFGVDHGLVADECWTLLRQCKGKGLVDDRYSTMGMPAANMTSRGFLFAEERKRLRGDRVERQKYARTHLLRWLWERKQEGCVYPLVTDFLKTSESLFVEERLTVSDIDLASSSLERKGLIQGTKTTGHRGPVRADTTDDGDYCVEEFGGDVAEFQRAQQAGGIHFAGDNNGSVAQHSSRFQQNSIVNEPRQAAVEVRKFVEQYRAGRATLEITPKADTELAEVVEDLHREANSDSPDTGRMRQGLERAGAILNSGAVSGALGNLLATGALSIAGMLTGS